MPLSQWVRRNAAPVGTSMILALIAAVAPARAQETSPGQVARSAAGIAGQRVTGEDQRVDTMPMKRLESRIQNRVQSRVRNRIDRYYDARAGATSPFEAAAASTGNPNSR